MTVASAASSHDLPDFIKVLNTVLKFAWLTSLLKVLKHPLMARRPLWDRRSR